MSQIKKVPMRRCVGCGEVHSKQELVRVVKTPEGQVHVDLTGRLNGRGAYICPSEACLKKAVKNKGIERSLDIKISEEIYELLGKELQKDQ